MNTLRSLTAILLIFIVAANVRAQDSLEERFQSPPNSAKPHTWWHWMNGYVSAEGITADLEAMKRTGIGGFQAFQIEYKMSPGPVKYMSKQWRRLMQHTITEANRLGLEMCFHNCAGWSSSGGPWIIPEASMQKVVWSQQHVVGPKAVDVPLLPPERRDECFQDIAVLAFPTPESEREGKPGFRLDNWQSKAGFERDNHIVPDVRAVKDGDTIDGNAIIDLSDRLDKNGDLKWQVPPGHWTIVRFGYTPTAVRNRPAPREGRGYECDKLSKSAAELHWKNTVQKVIDDAGPLAGKTLNNVLVDSYEVMQQNWTKGFETQFQNRMGYDLKNFLPALTGRVVSDLVQTERFLWDYRRVIADMINENYYEHFAEMCHRNGLQLSIEPYGKPGNLDNFAVADVADIPMGEWWARKTGGLHDSSSKMAASAAHTNGRRVVGAEAFTAGRAAAAFVQTPYSLKAQGDYFFCQGINRFIFHTFVHQPWDKSVLPGMTMGPWGFQNNRNNTWYEQGKAWNEYLARCQHLLQEGKFQADLCYFAGENAPQVAPLRDQMKPALPDGFDYDTISRKNLMKLTMEGGRLVLPGLMEYRLLVMPAGPVRPELLEKVHGLMKAGAHVVWAKPSGSPSLQHYPQADESIVKTAAAIWGASDGISVKENSVGQGKVYWPNGSPDCLAEILTALDVQPDVEFRSVQAAAPTLYGGVGYQWIHRKIDAADVYFISNQQETARQVEVVLRSSGSIPQLWNPQTGEIKQVPVYAFTEDGRTAVKLFMEAAESVFVVFQNQDKEMADAVSVVDVLRDGSAPYENMASDIPALKIIQATYGDLDGDSSRQADVTDRLQSQVALNAIDAVVNWKLLRCDPAKGVRKQLRVEYSIGDQRFKMLLKQNETLKLNRATEVVSAAPEPAMLSVSTDQAALTAWEPGEYELVYSNGNRKSLNVPSVPGPIDLSSDWSLQFDKDWGPGKIEVDQLISWTEHPDPELNYFSGTAVYTKQFDVPADRLNENHSVRLDLGNVKDFAEVTLNGKNLGILWKPPFKVDVTGLLKQKDNQLEMRVTNRWVNRLIGDARYPPTDKYSPGKKPGEDLIEAIPDWLQKGTPRPETLEKTFLTWKFHTKDSPLLESGLIGPVKLQFAVVKTVPK